MKWKKPCPIQRWQGHWEDLLTFFLFLQHVRFFAKALGICTSFLCPFHVFLAFFSISAELFVLHWGIPWAHCSLFLWYFLSLHLLLGLLHGMWHFAIAVYLLSSIISNVFLMLTFYHLLDVQLYLLNEDKYFLNEWVNYWTFSVIFIFSSSTFIKMLAKHTHTHTHTHTPQNLLWASNFLACNSYSYWKNCSYSFLYT